jgi:hypothetical protein
MSLQQLGFHPVDRGLNAHKLVKDVVAVDILIYHVGNSPDLAFNTPHPAYHLVF